VVDPLRILSECDDATEYGQPATPPPRFLRSRMHRGVRVGGRFAMQVPIVLDPPPTEGSSAALKPPEIPAIGAIIKLVRHTRGPEFEHRSDHQHEVLVSVTVDAEPAPFDFETEHQSVEVTGRRAGVLLSALWMTVTIAQFVATDAFTDLRMA
jgi:hypothetical protein